MPRESLSSKRGRAKKIFSLLFAEFPDPQCALIHKNSLELLIATILSAQCTDKKVNDVTPALFEKFPTTRHFAQASLEDLETSIRSIGLFRSKAKNIQACCRLLCQHHGGEVPGKMKELIALPGVGRKTANVVLGNAFGVNEGVVVDTHVSRISQLLKLSAASTPERIEQDLIKIIPQEEWTEFSHLLILHGRKTCIARRPRCSSCEISAHCPSAKSSGF